MDPQPPSDPCTCGTAHEPELVKPARGSAEWWDDPSAEWRCPACGAYRGDPGIVPVYEDDSGDPESFDSDDKIQALGFPCEFWSVAGRPDVGAMVDWPGCPLTITEGPQGLVVHAEVGSGGDYCPDADTDLDDLVKVDIGDLRLEYREPSEVAWLIGADLGDLREICQRIANATPCVSRALVDLGLDFDPPVTTYADRVSNGPWWSA